MSLLKVLAFILGSILFFPVSCSTALLVGYRAATHLDARDVARGDEVHARFSVAAAPGKDGQPFRLLRLSELPGNRANPGETFLMSKATDSMNTGPYARSTYSVLENQGTTQVIEVIAGDDDMTVRSRYRAKSGEVTPLSSRMNYFGYMFSTLPYALVFAVAVLWAGRRLRRRFEIGEYKPKAAAKP